MRNTWSPFQSPELREICRHLTDAEESRIVIRSGLYGIWIAATFACPIVYLIRGRDPWYLSLAAGLVLAHIACLPLWFKMQRRYLCSTEWARQQGFTPEKLRLYAFRK